MCPWPVWLEGFNKPVSGSRRPAPIVKPIRPAGKTAGFWQGNQSMIDYLGVLLRVGITQAIHGFIGMKV